HNNQGTDFLIIAGLFLLIACQNQSSRKIFQRDRDPWVMRSVLDQQIRMVTLALHRDGYAAYNTQNCALYKVWRGGVHWDGAPFNNVKTIQPISWGDDYLGRPIDEKPWTIQRNGQTVIVEPQFRGYRLEDNQITFRYELALSNGSIVTIYEQPEFLPLDGDRVGFQRIFRTEDVPDNLVIWNGGLQLPQNGEETFVNYFEPFPEIITRPVRHVSGSGTQNWLDRSGCNTCHEVDERTIGPAYREIAGRYDRDDATLLALIKKVKNGGSGVWGDVPMLAHPDLPESAIKGMLMYIMSLKPKEGVTQNRTAPAENYQLEKISKKPGFGAALRGLHPSLEVQTIHPAWFKPRVGGMDFLPDGRLLISTWDSLGAVYALRNVETGDSSKIEVERIASGLSEPLGLKVVDGEIFVLQKHELTQLIDHDGDGISDEYRTICNSFDVTADFHEFSYGLEYKDGFFYAGLGLAMRLMPQELQHPDRGTVVKIGRDGSFERIMTGLRQTNGIGFGPDNELFITENQGQWVPACKVIHVVKGAFHGCQYGTGERFKDEKMTPPAVWLPQDEIGNSPGQPVLISEGVYKEQLLHGEITHGGLKRVFLEKINGSYQGAVFRFTQGLEAGIIRSVWGPDGALYVGGVGMNGGWTWEGKQYGLQRLEFSDRITFEILKIEATAVGLNLTFTEPLAAGDGEEIKDYFIQQWWYEATPRYGGDKKDLESLYPRKISISNDGKQVNLEIPGMKEESVIYLLLNEELQSASGQPLWSGEAWYTFNSRP
ncbi:MAG: cytochrome C, partial [Bacteroidetes bacterium]|nr:cytochrome C [Bacteroidota bacterium]